MIIYTGILEESAVMKELNNRGFTLLELMISMSVLAVALMGILPFFFYAQAQITRLHHQYSYEPASAKA